MRTSNNKGVLLALIILLALIGYGAYAYMKKSKIVENDSQVVCTMDAMECPDGSSVGRTGPDCQFVCPAGSSASTTTGSANTSGREGPVLVEVKIGETVSPLGESITPLLVVEDSRCPTDVQCIQAGTVRVQTKLNSALGESTQNVKLGTPITTESEMITLVKVTPEKNSKVTLVPTDYRFTFQVTKR